MGRLVIGDLELPRYFHQGYDIAGSHPDCNGLGFSIHPRHRDSEAKHRGYPVLRPAHTTMQALRHARDRVADRPQEEAEDCERNETHAQMLDYVIDRLKTRPVGDDEETLTFHSGDAPGLGLSLQSWWGFHILERVAAISPLAVVHEECMCICHYAMAV